MKRSADRQRPPKLIKCYQINFKSSIRKKKVSDSQMSQTNWSIGVSLSTIHSIKMFRSEYYLKFYWLTFISLSLISQENIPGFSFFISSMRVSISAVATLGLEPPITPGRMLPVSWYLFKILETQPCETLNWREITQGRTPPAASSTIFSLIWFGSGLPLINTPPS